MPPSPRILAFDTSAAHCAAALLIDGRIVAKRYEEMARGQAERLVPLLEEVLADEGAVWEELDAIGVGIGPGNFTGVRIAVSAARGLSISLGVPAIGVSNFEVAVELAGRPGGRVGACLPAPRNSTYWQTFLDGDVEGAPFMTNHAQPHQLMAPPLDLVVGPAENCFAHVAAIDLGLTGMLSAPDDRRVDMVGRLVEAVATTAAVKFGTDAALCRPAPLYIRPADAAPPREAPPVILP